MGSKPKMPAAPPPSPTPPSFASSFLNGRSRAAAAGMGGTFLTQAFQPLVRKAQRKTLLGG